MKKILSIILGAFLCAQAFAQVDVNAGYVNSAYRYGENNYSYKVAGNGFYVGASTEFQVGSSIHGLSFEPGLNFNLIDYNFEKGIDSFEYSLSAPLRLKYSQPVSNAVDVFISAGPTLLCTLGSSAKVTYGGTTYTEKGEGGDFDVALGFEAGVKLTNNFKVVCGYDFGLINQSGDSDYRVTRNFLHVGIGYSF